MQLQMCYNFVGFGSSPPLKGKLLSSPVNKTPFTAFLPHLCFHCKICHPNMLQDTRLSNLAAVRNIQFLAISQSKHYNIKMTSNNVQIAPVLYRPSAMLGLGQWVEQCSLKGGLDLKPTKLEHIFVAVITFPPFLLCKYF